jgi:sialate O-acetylesterase
MNNKLARFVVLFIALFLGVTSWADTSLRLPQIFSDNMVLQQELPVVVWGWAKPEIKVTVKFGRQTKSVHTNGQGKWRVQLDPLTSDTKGRKLAVRTTEEYVEFENVLVGEVWLCSGQSNMEWPMSQINDAAQEIASADYPLMRHIRIDHVMKPEPVDDVETKKGWEVCTPDTVPGFTAVGYFFGMELLKKLDVPIGLLHSSWGGSNIEAFTSLEGFKLVPELSDYVQRIEASTPSHPAYKQAVRKGVAEVEKWIVAAKEALNKDERVATVPVFADSAKPLLNWVDPTNKHNAMIAGLVPYRIRGSIWYQGESNHAEDMIYVRKTEALVRGWRQAWAQPQLPYYYVQIAPFRYGSEPVEVLPAFWEVQSAIEKEIPHTGMVVINDVADINDIHPRNKKPVGYRLAQQALANTYKRDVIDGGPQFEKMDIEQGRLRVFFTRVGSGLATRDGKSPDWFEIAGEDGLFKPAQTRIDKNTVVLSHADMAKPAVMRYAWSMLAEPNLRNVEGFPVSAFRAGTFNERFLLDSLVPEAKAYDLVYSFDIGNQGTNKKTAQYRVDRAQEINAFDRVGYCLVLQKENASPQYVWVSMDPFANEATKLGVPTASLGETWQQWVNNVTIVTNVTGLKSGAGLKAYLEFWPNNYSPSNSSQIPGASEEAFDFGDTPASPFEGYGSMQVHIPAEKQTVFAINNWSTGPKTEVGIGNCPKGNPDYTFSGICAEQYQIKRLFVLVK